MAVARAFLLQSLLWFTRRDNHHSNKTPTSIQFVGDEN